MDNLLYINLTNIISLVSLIGAVVIVTIFVIKKKFSPKNIALLLLFFAGMYLFIPKEIVSYGYIYQNPTILRRVAKLSVNPYEKRLCYKYIAEIYANDMFYQGIKDGNKAIDYMEKALKGKYKKYPDEAKLLMYWYSIKGDEAKTFELSEILGIKTGIALRNIYIMKDDYENALSTFKDNKSVDNYLKADLYKKTGNQEDSKKALAIAEETYTSTLNNIKIRAKRLDYKDNVEKYRSIDNYKSWILAQRKEYGFN